MADYTPLHGKDQDSPLQAKLSKADRIRAQYATGSYSQAALSRMHHLSRQRIHEIVHTAQLIEEADDEQ